MSCLCFQLKHFFATVSGLLGRCALRWSMLAAPTAGFPALPVGTRSGQRELVYPKPGLLGSSCSCKICSVLLQQVIVALKIFLCQGMQCSRMWSMSCNSWKRPWANQCRRRRVRLFYLRWISLTKLPGAQWNMTINLTMHRRSKRMTQLVQVMLLHQNQLHQWQNQSLLPPCPQRPTKSHPARQHLQQRRVSNNPHQHLWPSWKDNRMQHQPATQGNANSQCTTSASTTQGGQRTSSQRQCTSSASAQCSTGSTTSASARYHPMRPSDVPHIALMFCLSCFFGWLGRQQTLLSFCGVNQHCYLSCGYHFEIASSSVWLRAEILEDCEMAEYVVTAFFELGNLDGGRVRQVKVLSFSCNFYTDTKKHWVSSLIYILVWFPLFHFFSLAIDCLRSRLLFKKDKAIDNWLMRAVRPLPA